MDNIKELMLELKDSLQRFLDNTGNHHEVKLITGFDINNDPFGEGRNTHSEILLGPPAFNVELWIDSKCIFRSRQVIEAREDVVHVAEIEEDMLMEMLERIFFRGVLSTKDLLETGKLQ